MLPTHDQQLATINKLRPDKPTRYLESGEMNDMILVDETEVFRFPRTTESCQRLEYESKVLQALNGTLTTTIPRLLHLADDKSFSILSYIEGEVLKNREIRQFSVREREQFTKQLAVFMRELNAHLSVAQLDEWTHSLMPASDTWDEYYAAVAKNTNSEYSDQYRRQYAKVTDLQLKAPKVPIIAIHGDLHAGNMLFKGTELNGVIDFGDCETGTIYNELRPLYSLGDTIVGDVIDHLDGSLGDVDKSLVREMAIMHELSVLVRSSDEELKSSSRVAIARDLLASWLGDNPPMQQTKIKAVIFDCFGVLTSERWIPFRRRYFHTDEAKAFARKAMGQLVTGQLNPQEFISTIAHKGKVDEDEVRESLTGSSPDEELFEWIRSNKQSYRIGMLSNVGSDRLHTLFTAKQIALFDDIVLSYDVGMAKPDPRVYRLAAERLSLTPEECVFIDDKEMFCKAARDVGMRAVKYHEFDQFKKEIATILT
jgi:putative hydrolase of the HAD superfamily